MEATLKKSSSLLLFRGHGELGTRARFSQDTVTFGALKQTCWTVAQFLTHKPLNFASLTDSFKIIEILSEHGKHKQLSGTFEKQAPWPRLFKRRIALSTG